MRVQVRAWASGGVLMAVLALIALVVMATAIAQCAFTVSGRTREVAQQEAEAWGRDMGLRGAHFKCADADTDGDGYVSCSGVITHPDGKQEIIPLECAGTLTINNGCRVPKAVVRQQR